MKIHIISPGFYNTEKFEKISPALIRIGIDKLVFVHVPHSNNEIKEKVENLILNFEKIMGLKAERYIIEKNGFIGITKEFKQYLEQYGNSDQIYVHISYGERPICLSMIYASFFSTKKIELISSVEIDKNTNQYDIDKILPIPTYKLLKKQKEILTLVSHRKAQTLTEIGKRIDSKDPRNLTPGILRQLKSLEKLRLIECNDKEKTYTTTTIGELYL